MSSNVSDEPTAHLTNTRSSRLPCGLCSLAESPSMPSGGFLVTPSDLEEPSFRLRMAWELVQAWLWNHWEVKACRDALLFVINDCA